MAILEEAGHIQIDKTFEDRRPRTWITVTRKGRAAYSSEIATLRQQLADLRAQLAVVERQPEEQTILEATRVAQDIPAAWATASPDQRRRIVWSVFEIIRIREGRIVSVRPRSTTAPLLG